MIQIKGEKIIFIHMIAVFIMFVCLFTCFSQEGVFAFGSTFGFEAPPKHCCLKTKGTTKSKKKWLIPRLFKRNNLATQRKIVKCWQF